MHKSEFWRYTIIYRTIINFLIAVEFGMNICQNRSNADPMRMRMNPHTCMHSNPTLVCCKLIFLTSVMNRNPC